MKLSSIILYSAAAGIIGSPSLTAQQAEPATAPTTATTTTPHITTPHLKFSSFINFSNKKDNLKKLAI